MAKESTDKMSTITTQVVKLLSGLDSDGRKKVIQASLTLLGDAMLDAGPRPSGDRGGDGGGTKVSGRLSPKADAWVKQNGITEDQLEQVFELGSSSGAVIAGSVPGKTSKDQTIAAYILRGIAQLVATGDPTFDDKSARKLCQDLGCFNAGNHAVYMKGMGNSMTGSKDKGWKLTAPGMKKGAELIKEMTKVA